MEIKDNDESINSRLTSNIISPSCNLMSSLSILLTRTPLESLLSITAIPKDVIIFAQMPSEGRTKRDRGPAPHKCADGAKPCEVNEPDGYDGDGLTDRGD